MRARSLKPGFFRNEILGSGDPLAALLFEGLWCLADREGRLEDRALRICAQVFPYRRSVTEKRCDQLLQWLHDEKFVTRYEVDGRRYIQVLAFWKHQKPHSKERPSEIPALTTIRHQPDLYLGSGQAPTKVRPKPEKGSGEHALTPDSGLLTPESSLRESVPNLQPKPVNGRKPDQEGARFELLTLVQQRYPPGTYTGVTWHQAEREIGKLLEAGETAETILASVNAYREQQQALGKVGTQFIRSPKSFFGEGHWRGPFPMPTTQTKAEETIAAGQEWLARSNHG